ncbi:MAG: TonB family protein [Capnocytophaga sp.]|nr:TonB family protein [Capnocytophaga sp.]
MNNFIQNIKKQAVSEFQSLVLSRQEKALILTLIVLMFIIAGLLVFQIGSTPKEFLIEISSPQQIEQIFEEKEEFSDENLQNFNHTELTTKAYNQADASLKQAENLKSLDQILAEQQAQDDNEKGENSLSDDNSIQETITEIPAEPKEELKKVNNEVNKNSLVKYSLEGRYATRELPNPIYTCEFFGKIVVNITVDMNGAIIDANINTQQSTSTNACLTDNALEYAKKARFSPDFNKPKQTGTITYIFQPKEKK